MRKMITAFAMLLTLAVLPAFSQQDQPAKATEGNQNQVTLTGTVSSYEPGKSIEVDAKGVPHKYDLTVTDTTFNISPDIAIGAAVKLTEKKDANGKKTVVIESAGAKKPTE